MGGKRRTVSLDELDHFEIDEDQQLFWEGKPVMTLTTYSIPWWAQAIAIGAGLSTIGLFVIGVIALFR